MTDLEEIHAERHSVTISAIIFAAWTALSRILGFIRDALIARYFSIEVRDAFIVAFRLPNLFRRLFGEGSLSVSFIPVFIENLHEKKDTERLVSGVFTFLMTISLTLTLLGYVFMEDILRLLLNGEPYLSVPGKFEMTVRLARIMFGFLTLVCFYAYLMAILNSLRKFALSAMGPCLVNICMIIATVLGKRLTASEEILAWSLLLGGILQILILLPSVVKSGYLPRFSMRWQDPEVMKVLKAFVPGLLGMSIIQMTPIVNLHFASHLPQGSHSYLYLADRIMELPLSLFVVSVSAALLPSLARAHTRGDKLAMAEAINHYMRTCLFLAIPAGVGIFVLALPMTQVLFQRGEFKFQDAIATAQVLQVYAFALLFISVLRILVQGFYAIKNTWFPAVAAFVALLSHILFAYALLKQFGLLGLAGATAASSLVNLMMLLVAFNSWIGPLQVRRLVIVLAKYIFAAAVMAGWLTFYNPILHQIGGRYFPRSTVLLLMIGVGILIYFVLARLMRVQEMQEILDAVSRKLKRRDSVNRA